MSRDNAIKGPQADLTLGVVLDVLLELAFDKEEPCWEKIKKNKSPDECDKLRRSLIVGWEGDKAKPDKQAWITVSSDFHLKRGKKNSLYATTSAIRACADGLKLGGRINTSDISDALKRLEIYGPCTNHLGGKTQGQGCRRFSIHFDDCRDRSKSGCKKYVLDVVKTNLEKESVTDAGYAAKNPRTDPLSSLDDRLRSCLEGVRSYFLQHPEVQERSIHVPLKVRLGVPGQKVGEGRECVPEAADFRAVVASPHSQMLLISEEGGAGKTSLAFKIARWALEGELADHLLLPILYDPAHLSPDDSLVQRVHDFLAHRGGTGLDLVDVEELLRKKRLLLILDHFSELSDTERQWVQKKLPPNSLVLLTSRLQGDGEFFSKNGWDVTRIQPQRLHTSEELFSFFENYLQAKEAVEPESTTFFTADNQTETKSLMQRMLGGKEITVLLAWMVIETAMKHVRDGEIRGLLPSSVPQLMRNYVSDIDKTVPPDCRCLDDGMTIQSSWVLDSLQALALRAHGQGEGWFPKDFRRSFALQILENVLSGSAQGHGSGPSEGLFRYLEEKLHLIKRTKQDEAKRTQEDENDPWYRLSLDPLADYLAAMAQLERLKGDRSPEAHDQEVKGWLQRLLGMDLEMVQGEGGANPLERSRGFLAACRDCFEEWLSLKGPTMDPGLSERWQEVPDTLAELAGIDQRKERILKAEYLIRRHARDLAWANRELRAKAIEGLTSYAKDEALKEHMAVTVKPLAFTMAEASIPHADRAAAAEALGHIGGTEAADSLRRMAANEAEAVV
ncbi:MAG: NACHT domain-containing protein, partial [Cyanobacteriota bacterium]